MGELEKRGILGGFSGQVGSVVGVTYHGMDLIKAMPRVSSKKAVQSQIDQRFKFKLMTQFLGRIPLIIKEGFKSSDVKFSSMNLAVKENLKNAITGTSPNFKLDFAKITLSNGNNQGVTNAKAEALPGSKIKLTWDLAADNDFTTSSDSVRITDVGRLVVYNESEDWSFINDTIVRGLGTITLRMPLDLETAKLHAWIFFVALDGKSVSECVYLGSIVAIP